MKDKSIALRRYLVTLVLIGLAYTFRHASTFLGRLAEWLSSQVQHCQSLWRRAALGIAAWIVGLVGTGVSWCAHEVANREAK